LRTFVSFLVPLNKRPHLSSVLFLKIVSLRLPLNL